MSLLLHEAGLANVRREGRDEGRVEGKAAMLLQFLALEFGQLTPDVVQRVRTEPEASLDSWLERFVSATTFDDAFAQS